MSFAEIVNTPVAPAGPALTDDILDFEVLKAFERIKSDDGSGILIELIDLYLQGTSRRITEMRNAAGECDWALLRRTAHTLKGSSSTLGLRQIAKACHNLETTAFTSTQDTDAVISLLESQFLEASPVLLAERNRRVQRSGESEAA